MSEQFFIIKVKRNLPVDIYRGDVMYFEKEHNAKLDEKMRALYLSRKGRDSLLSNELARENFIYLPVIVEELVGNQAVMDYYNPTHREVRQINPYEMIRECIIESGKETVWREL